MRKKHVNNGGSPLLSLHLDTTSMIIKAESFDVCLSFIPDVKICGLLDLSKASFSGGKTLLGTIAFVVLEVDKTEKIGGGTLQQFIMGDGPTNLVRAIVIRELGLFI